MNKQEFLSRLAGALSCLPQKVFLVRSNTGRIQVPETASGGKCKITTDTGDISIELS